ncbi:hypothetical protein YC2023_042809 [Brassica napus]
MMLCLEDMPEIERKPVKKLKKALKMVTKALGVLERTNRHKLAQYLNNRKETNKRNTQTLTRRSRMK